METNPENAHPRFAMSKQRTMAISNALQRVSCIEMVKFKDLNLVTITSILCARY